MDGNNTPGGSASQSDVTELELRQAAIQADIRFTWKLVLPMFGIGVLVAAGGTAAWPVESLGRRVGLPLLAFGILWLFKVTIGIRTEEDVETAGLDVSEHGMWGYPEFYIPVPGGYGTEAHGHLGLSHGHARTAPALVVPAAAPEPASG